MIYSGKDLTDGKNGLIKEIREAFSGPKSSAMARAAEAAAISHDGTDQTMQPSFSNTTLHKSSNCSQPSLSVSPFARATGHASVMHNSSSSMSFGDSLHSSSFHSPSNFCMSSSSSSALSGSSTTRPLCDSASEDKKNGSAQEGSVPCLIESGGYLIALCAVVVALTKFHCGFVGFGSLGGKHGVNPFGATGSIPGVHRKTHEHFLYAW